MSFEDINGCRETNDQISSGRRFICTSLSSSSSDEDDYMITLTASSFSLDSSDICMDISSRDEDLDIIEATLSPPVQMYQSESSGFSSGSRTVSGYSSLSSSYEIQYAELSNSDQDSDARCSFQDADISNSCHDTDEVSSRGVRGWPNDELLNVDQSSEDSSYFIDLTSTSAEDTLIFTGAKRKVQNLYAPLQTDLKSSSSDRECSLECSIKYHKYTYDSNFCRYTHSSDSDVEKNEDNKSDITVENISKISEERIKREDITLGWVVRHCYEQCSGLALSDSSDSYKTAESDFEELGFRDTFAFASSTKPKEFVKSSKEKSCNVAKKDDDIVPGRQCKVTFAPPESLVTVQLFERTTEEIEDDILYQAMVADAMRFQMRINSFKEMIDPFLTQEFRSHVMLRNNFLSMDL